MVPLLASSTSHPCQGTCPRQIAPLFGVLSTLVRSQLMPLNDLLHDTQNIIVEHGIAGLVRTLMTEVFYTRGGWRCPMASVAVSLPEGAWDGHWRQLW